MGYNEELNAVGKSQTQCIINSWTTQMSFQK